MEISRKSCWINRGEGIEELIFDDVADYELPNEESVRGPQRHNQQRMSIPRDSSPTVSQNLLSPPPTARKKIPLARPRPLRISHLDYDRKLKVPDTKGRKLPRMAFRWYDSDRQGLNAGDQIRAGLYKERKSRIPPPPSGPVLKQAFLNHLSPEKKIASPFISVFENFLPALHRGLKSRKPAYIAIIDLQQTEKNSGKRFPRAKEVIWPIKVIIKQHNFKLEGNYRGMEWLVYGLVENSAIVQTVKVSDIRDFARTGRLPHVRDFLHYITLQQHAFGLLDNLHIKPPWTGRQTGLMVGKFLEHLQIPDEYKALVARKVMNMVKFGGALNDPRQQAYLRGVYGIEATDEDIEIDRHDAFVVDDDEYYDSSETYSETPGVFGMARRTTKTTNTCIEDSEDDEDYTTSDENDTEDEQAQIDAQLHATLNEAIQSAPLPKGLRVSHVQVPKLLREELLAFKTASVHTWEVPKSVSSVSETSITNVIDLTSSGDEAEVEDGDDDVIEVALRTSEEDVVIVAAKRGRKLDLVIRSTSTRTTTGPKGLERLERDVELEEVMQWA